MGLFCEMKLSRSSCYRVSQFFSGDKLINYYYCKFLCSSLPILRGMGLEEGGNILVKVAFLRDWYDSGNCLKLVI